jgi:hypothetical protein
VNSALDDLRRELRADPPPAIAALDETDLARLAGALRAAREHQTAALTAATDHGLSFIPRLLRAPVKKVLFG